MYKVAMRKLTNRNERVYGEKVVSRMNAPETLTAAPTPNTTPTHPHQPTPRPRLFVIAPVIVCSHAELVEESVIDLLQTRRKRCTNYCRVLPETIQRNYIVPSFAVFC